MGKIELDVGDYSINDIKAFFTFRVGDIIESTSNHQNGTYMTLRYIILDFQRYGATCRLISISGNYQTGEYVNSTFYDTIHKTFIHGQTIRKFFKKISNEQ